MTTAPDFAADIPLEISRAAHAGTSHSPDERGDQERTGYAARLAADLATLEKLCDTDEKRAALAEEFARYRAGYRSRYLARLGAMGRCMSTLVTGRSNFPVRSQAKRSDAAEARTTELIEYRTRALDAIRKVLCPELRPIMAGDANAVERVDGKLEAARARQALMVATNAAIRTHRKAGAAAQVPALVALGHAESTARILLQPDDFGRIGFAAYQLTNNGAEIRRLEKRGEKLVEAKATPDEATEGERARLEVCAADNRVRLFYPGKPDDDTRARLKGCGFRWTPSLGCWQAYVNHRSVEAARREAGATA
jgi:hypothetical protein